MNRFCALVAALGLSGSPAAAEDLMFDYFSHLGPTDAFNSRGVPLDDLCALAQQDRANWHRFKKREEFDSADPFFTTPARRALFADRCQYDRSYFANAGQRIRNGTRQFYVYVGVYGSGGQVTRIVIAEGAG